MKRSETSKLTLRAREIPDRYKTLRTATKIQLKRRRAQQAARIKRRA